MSESREVMLAIVASAALLSWLLVAAVRRYTIARGVLDHPSERSSHAVVTPRGGGIGLIAAVIAVYLTAAPEEHGDWEMAAAIAAVVLTAGVGWLDDRSSLSVRHRLAAHILAGGLLVPIALTPTTSLPEVLILGAAWVAATVSAVNVVNFIDGIDGLIGLQAVIFGTHIFLLADPGSDGAVLGLSMAAASAGFLLWNWPPARIFLGDAGSGSIAVLGVLGGILVWRAGGWPFTSVFLPILPIFADAAVTIVRRARRGEKLTTPHRSHLYQRLANEAGWGHARVSLLYGVTAGAGAVIVSSTTRPWLAAASAAYMAGVFVLGWLLERLNSPAGA